VKESRTTSDGHSISYYFETYVYAHEQSQIPGKREGVPFSRWGIKEKKIRELVLHHQRALGAKYRKSQGKCPTEPEGKQRRELAPRRTSMKTSLPFRTVCDVGMVGKGPKCPSGRVERPRENSSE